MVTMTTKKEIKKIEKNTPGKTRGTTFITDANYIEQKKGQEGLKKLQQQMDKWDIDIDYKKIRNNDWYPAGWRIISLLAIKKTFNWGDKEIFKMGETAPKNSFVVKTLLRYFVSTKKTFKETVKYWDKHWTVGELVAKSIDTKNKRMVLRIYDFEAHPVLCQFLRGYFKEILKLTTRGGNCSAKEKKCASKGDPYHEFVLKW